VAAIKALLVGIFFLSFPVSSLAAMPAGFEIETIAGGLNLPTAMTFAPDGRIFVAEKLGKVRVIKNGVLLPTPMITLSDVNSYGDRGLIGIAVDPNFSSNGYVYLSYTYEN
jgi:glucose/arabinose dehydrogenase